MRTQPVLCGAHTTRPSSIAAAPFQRWSVTPSVIAGRGSVSNASVPGSNVQTAGYDVGHITTFPSPASAAPLKCGLAPSAAMAVRSVNSFVDGSNTPACTALSGANTTRPSGMATGATKSSYGVPRTDCP